MKTLTSYLSILLIVLTFTSCEVEDNFLEPNIELVAIYSITNIQGADTPLKINIYKQNNLIVEYRSSVNVSSYVSTNYNDTSTDTTYNFEVNKKVDGASVNYLFTGDKSTGEGIMTIDGSKSYDITISEEEVYN